MSSTACESCPCSNFNQKAAYGTMPYYEANEGDMKKVVFCVHGKVDCSLGHDGDESINQQNRKESSALHPNFCHRENNLIDKKARRKLIIASVLCVVFMIGEIVGGFLANSLAIATDAAHLLTDFASFMISLFALWVASRPATQRMNFGWHRAEVIGALTSVLMIWLVTGVLVYLAVERIVNGDFEINAVIMLITSGVGVLVNIIMGFSLHQHGHSHGGHSHGGHSHGGHSHDNNTAIAESGHAGTDNDVMIHDGPNINVRAAFIHVIGDFLQSIGVFTAALIIYFKPTWVIVDPICTFLFSILVLITTFAILKDTLTVLMEGIPRGVSFDKVLQDLLKIEGVVRVHNLRIWALTMDKTALSAHLAIKPGVSPQSVLRHATFNIQSNFNIYEMTLQIEEFKDDMDDCRHCENPKK